MKLHRSAALWLALAIVIMLFSAFSLAEENTGAQYRQLKKGDTGYDVYLLKIRLYQLGYLPTDRATERYTASLVQTVRTVQERNGLEPTGTASPAFQKLLYSDSCVPADTTPKPPASAVIGTIDRAPTAQPDLPSLDGEGFLAAGSREEFVYENEEDGLWYYISSQLYVEIRRFTQTGKTPLVWYETKVALRGIEPEAYSSEYKRLTNSAFVSPARIAADHHAVLAISDDTYTWRTFYNRRTGIVIRNGDVISNTPYNTVKGPHFPNMDVMAFLPDGTMALYENGETTPEHLLALGAKNVYSFGPILLRDGQESLQVRYCGNSARALHPRCAIGQLSPDHYLILTVVGRAAYSKGCTLAWLADRMRDLGVKNAINLDGGGSAALVFMGKILNHKSKASIRMITDVIGFGTSDSVTLRE